jgi:hypothetical protein
MAFVQTPNGTVLPDGQLDAIHATDIGQWAAGIPGVITNTGTTGFVTDRGFGIEYGTAGWVGGLQTTTTIGSYSFTFDFLPSVGFGAPPPTMTPFASSPPPATLVSTAATSTGDEATAFRSAESQPAAEPSQAAVRKDADAGTEAHPAGDNTPSAEAVAPTRASTTAPATETTTDPATTTDTSPAANDPTEKKPPTHTKRRSPADITDAAGATEPDTDSDSDGAPHSAAANTSRTADSPNEATGRHRADDGTPGKHRSDDGSPGSETNSKTSGSESSE